MENEEKKEPQYLADFIDQYNLNKSYNKRVGLYELILIGVNIAFVKLFLKYITNNIEFTNVDFTMTSIFFIVVSFLFVSLISFIRLYSIKCRDNEFSRIKQLLGKKYVSAYNGKEYKLYYYLIYLLVILTLTIIFHLVNYQHGGLIYGSPENPNNFLIVLDIIVANFIGYFMGFMFKLIVTRKSSC